MSSISDRSRGFQTRPGGQASSAKATAHVPTLNSVFGMGLPELATATSPSSWVIWNIYFELGRINLEKMDTSNGKQNVHRQNA